MKRSYCNLIWSHNLHFLSFETPNTFLPILLAPCSLAIITGSHDDEDDNSLHSSSFEDDLGVKNRSESSFLQQEDDKDEDEDEEASKFQQWKQQRRSSKGKHQRGVLTESSQNKLHQRRINNSYNSTMSDGRRSRQKRSSDEMTPEDRIEELVEQNTGLEKENRALKKQRRLDEKEITALANQIQRGDPRVPELEAQIQALEALVSKNRRGAVGVPHDDVLETWLSEKARQVVWATHPFIGCNEDLMNIMEELLKQSQEWAKIEAKPTEQAKKDLLQDYVTTYGKVICQEVNQKRNNTSTAIHKIFNVRKKSGAYLPKSKTLLYILRRNGLRHKQLQGNAQKKEEIKAWNKQVDKNRSAFDWMVDEGIGKIAGRNRWQHHKYYGPLSTYAPKEDPKKPFVTPGDEALLILMIENYENRWNYELKCEAKDEKVDRTDSDYETLYSDNACGQCQYGGWNQAGRDRFRVLKRLIRR